MSKKCPYCLNVFDDHQAICTNCGSRLVDDFGGLNSGLNLNIGDANAISGGVNINRSKNITSHDTHYHSTTFHERTKSDSELKLEATNQLRLKAEEIITERGRIDSVAMAQLRPFALQLGIDDETFKSIIKDVRSNRNGSSSGLSAANARYLLQAQQAVQTNDMDGLSNLTPRLEAMAAISQDDNVQYLYYLTLSLLYPIKSMEVYEHQTDENYWRSFWAIISYIRTGKYAEATKVLTLFEPIRFEKSEEDQNLLEAYFNIMKEDKDGAQEFLDEILGEPSEQIRPLLRAVESKLYDEDVDSLEVRFYTERVLSKSDVVVKTSKKVEALNSSNDLGIEKNVSEITENSDNLPNHIAQTLDELIAKIKNNDYVDDELYSQRLAPAVKKCTNPLLHYYYYLLKASFDFDGTFANSDLPKDASYWQTFWAAVGCAYHDEYSTQPLMAKAEELVLQLCELWPNHPQTNITLLQIIIDVFRSSADNNYGRDAIKNRYLSLSESLSPELSGLHGSLRYIFGMCEWDELTTEEIFYEQSVMSDAVLYRELEDNDNSNVVEDLYDENTTEPIQEIPVQAATIARISDINIHNLTNQIELTCTLGIENCKINSEHTVTLQWSNLRGNRSREFVMDKVITPYEFTIWEPFRLAILGYDDFSRNDVCVDGVQDIEFIIRVHDETSAIIGTTTITCQLKGKLPLFKDPSVECLQIHKVY